MLADTPDHLADQAKRGLHIWSHRKLQHMCLSALIYGFIAITAVSLRARPATGHAMMELVRW